MSNRSGFVVRGHGRLAAARLLGKTTVPIDRQEYADEASEYADLIADNRIAELAEMDLPTLKDLLEQIDDGSFDMDLTGFDTDALERMMTATFDDVDVVEDKPPDPPAEPITQPGDLWLLGDHRLLCGDSTDPENFDRLLDGTGLDAIITDPPYGVDYVAQKAKTNPKYFHDRTEIANDNLAGAELQTLVHAVLELAFEHANQGAGVYVFHSDAKRVEFENAFRAAGWHLHQVLIWVKQQFVLSHARLPPAARAHPLRLEAGRTAQLVRSEEPGLGLRRGRRPDHAEEGGPAAPPARDPRRLGDHPRGPPDAIGGAPDDEAGPPHRPPDGQQHPEQRRRARPIPRQRHHAHRRRAARQDLLRLRARPHLLRRHRRAVGGAHRQDGGARHHPTLTREKGAPRMARTGRPPKPIEQHKAEGTLASHHPKTPLLQGGREQPECPDHLRGNARRAFEIITEDLAASGIIDSADRTLIVAAAMHYGLAIDAQEALDKFGVMYPVTRGARDGSRRLQGPRAQPSHPHPARRARRVPPVLRPARDRAGSPRTAGWPGGQGHGPAQRALPGIGEKPALKVVGD